MERLGVHPLELIVYHSINTECGPVYGGGYYSCRPRIFVDSSDATRSYATKPIAAWFLRVYVIGETDMTWRTRR